MKWTNFSRKMVAHLQQTIQSDDEVIIERIRAGDIDQYEQIMRRYNQRLFRIARGILRNDEEAKDVVQETYITCFMRLDQFKGPLGFGAWLGRIATNQALMRLRKSKKIVSLYDEGLDMEDRNNDDLAAGPEQIAANDQLKDLLEANLDTLPENFRLVFVLREVEHLSTRETAEILDIKEETVKTRLYRAKQLLQSKLLKSVEKSNVEIYEFAGKRCDAVVSHVMAYLKRQ